MSRFNAIDLSQMAAPDVVQVPDYAALVANRKAAIIASLRATPEVSDEIVDALEATLQIEGELITKLIESGAYRQTIHYARVNDAARAVMLAFAVGRDLDHLGAYYGVERAVVTPATNQAPAVLEADARYRRRIQLAPEALATTGPEGAYLFHTYGVDPSIKHAGARRVVEIDDNGYKHVVVALSFLVDTGDGSPSSDLLEAVMRRLSEEDIRPLTDEVTVSAAPITHYAVNLSVTVADGPDPAAVVAAALAKVQAYVNSRHEIDRTVYLNGIRAAAHVPGVENVIAVSPSSDVTPAPGGACYATTVTVGVI